MPQFHTFINWEMGEASMWLDEDMKLNTNAVVDSENGKLGYGWVLRDENGLFKAATCNPGKCFYFPKMAEAIAIRETLTWMKSHELDFLPQEKMDSK